MVRMAPLSVTMRSARTRAARLAATRAGGIVGHDAVGVGLAVHQQARGLTRVGTARESHGNAGDGRGQREHDGGDFPFLGIAGGQLRRRLAGEDGDVDPAGGEIGIQRRRIGPAAIDAARHARHAVRAGTVRIEGGGDECCERRLHIGLIGHQVVACLTVRRQPSSVSSAEEIVAVRPSSSVIRSAGRNSAPGNAGSRTVQ